MASDIQSRKPHPAYNGYFQIPNSNFYINVYGKIWDDDRSCFIAPTLPSASKDSVYGTYPMVSINGIGRSIHMLVAEVFVEKPISEEKLTVNHIDGNKQNYFAGNLEWVTYSENLTHAFKTGLRSDNIPVLLKDLETNKISRFYSMNECARHLDINTSHLHLYMKREQTLPFMKKWDVVREGRSWNPIPDIAIGLERIGKERTIFGVKKSTSEVYLFSSISKAVEYSGISKNIIHNRLKRNDTPKIRYGGAKPTPLAWEFFYHKNYRGSMENVKEILGQTKVGKGLVRPTRPPIPILVKNLKTGEVKSYASTADFCAEKNAKKGTVQRSVYLKGRWKQYEIKYQKSQQNDSKPASLIEISERISPN